MEYSVIGFSASRSDPGGCELESGFIILKFRFVLFWEIKESNLGGSRV